MSHHACDICRRSTDNSNWRNGTPLRGATLCNGCLDETERRLPEVLDALRRVIGAPL